MARKREREKAFPTEDAQTGFGLVGGKHWQSANVLADLARSEATDATFPHSRRVPSAICLYHATLECVLNENLAMFTGPRGDTEGEAQYKDRIEWVHRLQDEMGGLKALNILREIGILD